MLNPSCIDMGSVVSGAHPNFFDVVEQYEFRTLIHTFISIYVSSNQLDVLCGVSDFAELPGKVTCFFEISRRFCAHEWILILFLVCFDTDLGWSFPMG